MNRAAEPLLIDDLVEPRLSEQVRGAMTAVEPLAAALDWSPEAVCRQAITSCGLDDFDSDLHVEPLSRIVKVMAPDGDGLLSPLGQMSCHARIVQFLRNKLLVTDFVKRHPEIVEIEIVAPIFIAGQGRTGTTHLHNLMSSDPALRAMPYWESLEPVPPLAEQGLVFARDRDDPRYQRCSEALSGLNTSLPHFRRMHDMYPEHVHEEIQLLAIAFGGQILETMVTSPTWRDWYRASDQTPYYEYLKLVLQLLTFLRPSTSIEALARRGSARPGSQPDRGSGAGPVAPVRWLLKSPQHVEQLGPLMAVFPDAKVICTHRDPVSVTRSLVTMMTYTARMSRRLDRLVDVGRYWADRVTLMFQALLEGRHLLPDAQSMDIRFEDFMADDVVMVRRIYEFVAQPFDDTVEAGMRDFMVAHPRGVHGRLRYDLTPFGIDLAERREVLQPYVDRFGLTTVGLTTE